MLETPQLQCERGGEGGGSMGNLLGQSVATVAECG